MTFDEWYSEATRNGIFEDVFDSDAILIWNAALEAAARTVDQLAASTVRYEERDVYESAAGVIRTLKRQ